MPRKPVISRTMLVTKAVVLCVDRKSEKTVNVSMLLPRTYKDEKNLLAAAEKHVSRNRIPVKVISTETAVERFGMTEDVFLKYAKKLKKEKGEKNNGRLQSNDQ